MCLPACPGLKNLPKTCDFLGMDDQYEPVEGAVGQYRGGECAMLQWSHTGCGWVVTAPASDDIPTGPPREQQNSSYSSGIHQ